MYSVQAPFFRTRSPFNDRKKQCNFEISSKESLLYPILMKSDRFAEFAIFRRSGFPNAFFSCCCSKIIFIHFFPQFFIEKERPFFSFILFTKHVYTRLHKTDINYVNKFHFELMTTKRYDTCEEKRNLKAW